MKKRPYLRRLPAMLLSAAFVLAGFTAPIQAVAGTTGAIVGSVTDASTGAPIADVAVTAASPSGTQTSKTNARGFYILQSLIPDTYTMSFQANGYQPQTEAGVTVQQDINVTVNARLEKTIKTIANVRSRSGSSLVKPNVTQDEYTVTGDQLYALSGGNDLHKTLYQYIQGVPGITATGFQGQPRIHGGGVTDEQYEFDGIPIRERILGFFTTNLSNVGIKNVEVYTGGLDATQAAAGLGIINTVVKTGTYPGFGIVSYGTAVDGSRLTDFTAEYGGATPNHRFSWYAALDKTNALNEFASGLDYNTMINAVGDNPPGIVKTTDVIGNFHYKPNNVDDFQFLIQNGVGEFAFDDGLVRQPGEPPPVTAVPCPGYVANPATATGASGGTAPDGETCPIGLYFGTADTQSGGGNFWHHYSGIGKIQWNHILNDHSLFALRFSENFNQYIYDQPVIDDNIAAIDNSPDFQTSPACTANHPAPYLPGTPIFTANPDGTGAECQQQQNWRSTGFTGDRRSNMWIGALDYTNTLSANTTLKAGVSQEYDTNMYNSYFSWYFNGDGSWPGDNNISNYPTHVTNAYVDVQQHFGKWLVHPGLLYQHMNYDYPGGPLGERIWNPTFSLSYQAGRNDVFRGSYTDSTSFVGTYYVYRQGNPTYNPDGGTFSASPALIHSYDLQWEHEFDANTSLRIGPYYNVVRNLYELFRPVVSVDASGEVHYGPAQAANTGFRQSFGAELGLNHVDHNPIGVSYYLSATYDNFWQNSVNSLVGSYGQSGNNALAFFPPVRSSQDPLFSAELTMDLHKNGMHLIPQVYYQGPSFYQTGECAASSRWQNLTGVGTPYYACSVTTSFLAKPAHLLPELMSNGYWWGNITGLVSLGAKKDLTLGMSITNLFDQEHDTTPCWVTQQVNTSVLGPGCSPYYPYYTNPGPALKVNSYQYQNYSETPTQIQIFLTKQFP